MNLTMETDGEGATVFWVKAHAGARRNRLAGVHDGALKVEVTTAPEKGKANKAILALLAKELGVARNRCSLLAGQTSPKKKIAVVGLDPAAVERALAASMKG